MYLSSGPSFSQISRTSCTMEGFCLLYLLKILLMRSGDVETNPGPDRIVSEKELLKLSKQIEPSYYKEVGINLDISIAELGQIEKDSQSTSDALMTVFMRWRDKQPPGTDIRTLLAEGLEGSDLGSLSGELLTGSLVPTRTGAPVIRPGSHTSPLSPDLIKRCADDFKFKYRTTFCKIRADPLNTDSIVPFTDMYTNLVLEEGYRDHKRPLEYRDLFDLKVNGEFPKQIMVQGEAGAGKTTFCAKIAWDWITENHVLPKFVWVLVVPFREAKQYMIGEIAKSYLSKDNPATACQITEYIRSNPKDIIAFDGLDELDGKVVQQRKAGSKSECHQPKSSTPTSDTLQPRVNSAEASGSSSERGDIALGDILSSDELAARCLLKEFGYFLYFMVSTNQEEMDFLLDVSFESQDLDTAALVRGGTSSLTINHITTAHTIAGYVFTGLYKDVDRIVNDAWSTLEEDGILEDRLIQHMWQGFSDQKDTLVQLMAIFDLICEAPVERIQEEQQYGVDTELIALRRHIKKVAMDEPYMGEEIPLRWLYFEENLATEENYMSLDQTKELLTMLTFYHDLGYVVYYEGIEDQKSLLKDMVILNPQWLIDVFKQVITILNPIQRDRIVNDAWSTLEEDGILEDRLIQHMWQGFSDQKDILVQLMGIFDLICEAPVERIQEEQQYGVDTEVQIFKLKDVRCPTSASSHHLVGTLCSMPNLTELALHANEFQEEFYSTLNAKASTLQLAYGSRRPPKSRDTCAGRRGSGDVETNPGQNRIVSVLSEKELLTLSKKIEPSFYKEVGINLDISDAELGQIKERSQNTSDALMTVFKRWRDKQPPGTDMRALLAEKLERSDLGSLSAELLAGSLVLKGAGISVQSKSNEESSSPTHRSDKTTSYLSSPNNRTSTTTPTTAAAATTISQKDKTTSYPSSPNTRTSTTTPTAAAATTISQKAFFIITLLAWVAVTVSGTTPEISSMTGDTVNIPCLFGEGTVRNIYWSYNDGNGRHKILFLADGNLHKEAEYANRASLQDDFSTLILKDITVADEGTYYCVVDRQGQTAVTNINTQLNVFSLRPDTLPVISPCTGADESSSCSIHANQSFTLTCTLPDVHPVEDTKVIWYQDGQHVSSTDNGTQNDDGTTDISQQIQVSETGIFTCNATYLSANGRENTAVSVEAWIIHVPPTDVPNTPGINVEWVLIFGLTTFILMLLMAAIIFFHRNARGQRCFRRDVSNSNKTQLNQVRRLLKLRPI